MLKSKKEAKEQLGILDVRLGKGVGASKERSRLQKVIDNDQNQEKKKEKKDETN